MTDKEIKWIKQSGKIGACDECPFRKSIYKMNTELLPCNQYQCLVKLAKLDKPLVKEENNKDTLESNIDITNDNKSKNAERFNFVSRENLPARIAKRVRLENELIKTYVNKTFGTYKVLEFAGYELCEVAQGRKKAGTEYVNYIFKCQCKRCGSVRYVTSSCFFKQKKGAYACPNCRRFSDDDERLIEWNEE